MQRGLIKMVDLTKFNATFIQEKRKDLEFLESVDYERLDRIVDSAIQSRKGRDLAKAKQQIDNYCSRILRDRSTQIPVKNIDDEINRHVSRYQNIRARIDTGVQHHRETRESQFKSNYGSKTPDIALLRNISDDYADLQSCTQNLDETIMKYAGFSSRWTRVEKEVGKIIIDYQNITSNTQAAGIRKRVQKCKKTLQEIEKDSPRKLFRGVHKAYLYRNKTLDNLEAEIPRFEKENFAKKKNRSQTQIAKAKDFIELLQNVKNEDVYTVLEEFSKHSFETELSEVAGTIYFGNLAREHTTITNRIKSAARRHAREYQEEFKKMLQTHQLFDVVDNQSTTDLKEQGRILREEYGGIANVLYQITGDDTAKKELDVSLQYVSDKITEIQQLNTARKEAAEELARAKDQLEEAKNALEKEKQSYHAKEKQKQEEIKKLEKEKETIASSLEAEKKTRSDLQKKVDGVLGRFNSLTQQIELSNQTLAQEISTQVDQKLQRVEKRIKEDSEKRAIIPVKTSQKKRRTKRKQAVQSDVFDFDLNELIQEKEEWIAQFI